MRRHTPSPYETPPPHSIAEAGVMHDYNTKYGTLSGGSALSQSMRYAEPWLYGSMSARSSGPRPSILAYPEPTVILGTPLITCGCKDFLSGTTREKKKSSGSVCKKCGGSRKTSWNVNSSSRIRGFGTVRLSQPKSRPELPALEELKDPYDIMRKSRLAAVSSTLRIPLGGKSRAKSTSPSDRRRNRSKSPPPRHRSPDRRVADMKSLNLNNLVDKNDSSSRKSILECDVNPYELITQYLKHGDPGDSRFSIDEDELSDNLSENALDEPPLANRGRSKSRGVEDSSKLRKSATASSKTKRGFLDTLKTKREDTQKPEPLQPIPGGVSIGGQRIRLFNSNDPIPIVTCANEFVSDSEENEEEVEEEIYDLEKHKAWFANKKNSEDSSKESKVPRVSNSPKRPPRKLKSGLEHVNSKKDIVKSTNETSSKNRVNFALDVPTQSNRRSNSLTSAVSVEIKSILKKPNSTVNLSGNVRPPRTLTSFSSPVTKEEAKPASRPKTPTATKNSPVPSRNTNQQTQNRKKKQVQFIVTEGVNSGNTPEASVESGQEVATLSEVNSVNTSEDVEEVPRFQFFGDNQEDAQAVNQIPQHPDDIVGADGDSSEDPDGRRNVNGLQRSLSDCMSSGAEPGSKFNDTMRLRLRTARRDSREVFSQDGRKVPERRVLSPGRPRPKEPPPPPPPPALDSGSSQQTSTSQFFGTETTLHQRLQEKQSPDTIISEGTQQPPPPPPPPRQIFPFTKEEIKQINQSREKKEIIRPRSSSNSPVRENTAPLLTANTSRRTSVPVLGSEGALWHKEESIVKDDFTPFLVLDENVPDMETFSSVTEVYEALEKNSKEIEESKQETNDEMDKEKSVKLVIPSASVPDLSLNDQEFDQTCTVVTVSSPQNIPVTNQKTFLNKKTSIMITGKERDEVEQKVNKTSVLIGNYKSSDSSECNKVTINVGGYNNQNDSNKTDQNNSQNEMKNNYKSNIIIGPSDNKSCTLLVVQPLTIPNGLEISAAKDNISSTENGKRTRVKTIHREAEEEMNKLIRNNVDPVEAARKNIVPHVCGLDKLTIEELKEKEITPNTVEKLDYVEEERNAENNLKNSEREVIFNTLSSIESEENLDDDVFASKDDTDENSDCYVCAKKLKKSGQNKHDDEDIKGIEFDSDENHYEVIRDPIYEEISETPPPLPLSPPPTSAEINDSIPTRSIFEGASKYDILNYLETAKERGIVAETEDDLEVKSPLHSRISSLDLSSRISQLSNASDSSEDSCNLIIAATDNTSITSDKVRKSSVEIERNDSGVGSESSKCSRSRWQHLTASQQHSCEDCDQPVETQVTDSGLMFAPLVCRKCAKRRGERREIITEIVETEEKYGRDLKIMLDEFYRPMLVAGLLTPEQLSAIFLNVEELLENNAALAEKLRDALEIAIDQGDEDLLTVNIGSIFLDAVPMLHAFESYCTRQGTASLLLANLEKEKELLRIFLRVSQMENSVLRRMNLNSFLMVPVQRVTKYPLLLARLYRVTPAHLKSRDTLRLAQSKIELHLEHINSLAKDISTTKLWRRISIINGRRSSSEIDMINIKLRKVAVSVLEWNHDEVRFAVEGKLLFTQPTDNNWRRGRTIKLSPVNAMLVTLGKPTEDYQPDSDELLAFPRKNGIRDASLLLLKEKSGRYGLLREPLFLDRCIICCEADIEDYFEVQELATKDTYLFKAEDGEQTKRWFRQLQYHAQGLGAWRKRRNALANIMINGMQLRT